MNQKELKHFCFQSIQIKAPQEQSQVHAGRSVKIQDDNEPKQSLGKQLQKEDEKSYVPPLLEVYFTYASFEGESTNLIYRGYLSCSPLHWNNSCQKFL